jgi:hypothetical protein
MRIARQVDLDLQGSIVSLDGVYDCRPIRKAIFNRGMIPNINPSTRTRVAERSPSEAASRCLNQPYLKNDFGRSSGCSPGKTNFGGYYFALIASVRCTTHSRPLPTQ